MTADFLRNKILNSLKLRYYWTQIVGLFNKRWSLYRMRYGILRLGAWPAVFIASLFLTAVVQEAALILTTHKLESPTAVFRRLFRIDEEGYRFNIPSLQDTFILAVFFLSLSVIVMVLRGRLHSSVVMRTFKPLARDLSLQSKALKALLVGLIKAPRPKSISPARYDANLETVKFDCDTSIQSATAFFTMQVDPEHIELCFRSLLNLCEPGSLSPGIRRIVACTTITPKQWLNAPLVSYLITTLGLEPSRGTTAAHKCRYYYTGTSELDEHDHNILRLLKRIHGLFGFKFQEVFGEQLTPIFSYQKNKYETVTPDPAFLFVEFSDDQALFYRIAVRNDYRGPFNKIWIKEDWDPKNLSNRSIGAYRQVIEELCPLPSV